MDPHSMGPPVNPRFSGPWNLATMSMGKLIGQDEVINEYIDVYMY
jgi:hypothetical protein